MEDKQNCCLMTTSINDEGRTILTYIPLSIDVSVVDFFLKNGTCTNKQCVEFELELSEEEHWKRMWETLMEDVEPMEEGDEYV